jgi:hypothetical protein
VTEQPKAGELLVGAYLKLVEECELVTYNQRSPEQGNQLEVDVIGVKSTSNGGDTVYTCEVVTHLNGLNYSGTPNTQKWEEYGNSSYQHTLERIERKFESDREYVRKLFRTADLYVFQLWSPVVPRGHLTRGLSELATEFGERNDSELELIINERYTERLDELREDAGQTQKNHGELGFRMLQIIEHLR